jgi:hypothetical protein
LDEDSLNFAPEEHIRQVPVALDLEDEAMRDTNSLDSKPQLEGVSERGRARRVNVGNGFLSFDPASHFENTEAVLRMMEEHLEALKDGGESAVAKAPDTTTLGKAPVNTPRSTFDALHAFQMAGAKLLAEKHAAQNQEVQGEPGNRSRIGNGFRSFDPACHFEGTEELLDKALARPALNGAKPVTATDPSSAVSKEKTKLDPKK